MISGGSASQAGENAAEFAADKKNERTFQQGGAVIGNGGKKHLDACVTGKEEQRPEAVIKKHKAVYSGHITGYIMAHQRICAVKEASRCGAPQTENAQKMGGFHKH